MLTTHRISSFGNIFRELIHSVREGLIGSASLGAITLMGTLPVVELQIAIQVALQLVETFEQRFAERHLEELFLYRAPEPFTEAVGFRGSDVSPPVLDLTDGQEQLERMLQSPAAEFPPIVPSVPLVSVLVGVTAGQALP